MSAKDPRRSIPVRVPDTLRGFVRAERRLGRTFSAAAALRRIVERQLPHGFVDHGVTAPGGGQVYRLQLGRSGRARLAALSRHYGFPEPYVLMQLVASAAIRESGTGAPGAHRHRPEPAGREVEGSFC